MRSFDDARPVEIAFTIDEPVPIVSPASGTITGTNCAAGVALRSGASDFQVNGTPIVNLATEVPLWRDLRIGDSGEDVLALQEELARLVGGVTADGVLGSGSIAAFDELRPAHVPASTEPVIAVGEVLWLPADSTLVTSCAVPLGASVEAGARLVEVAGAPAQAALTAIPERLIDGERKLLIGDVVVPLDDAGVVGAEADRAALADTPVVRSALASDPPQTVSGELSLLEPIEVGAVPPSALYRVDGDDACVLVDGAPIPVRIIGSQLGETFVEFPSTPPEAVALAPGRGASECR
ncbi:peptidoglycan-binding domain-containing protein [Agromyces archimandritae]|uniref:Uncharacterized protein n=1 Tax=Agromyces archimandritae TaxID=2781962 RepID=A0A975IQR8_9MICO|nr:hypothetical protein [Agromyces archimandritae]QTX05331.1 hypothetical protein G127AT_03640 [Agromyces archimandritae]